MFKDRLRNLRKENNLTQEELAKKIFVSRSTICKWEIGNGIPSDANLESLCNLFNVSKEWLLDLEDYKVYVNKKIKTYKLSHVITLLVFAFISGIMSIILLAGLSYLNTYNDIGTLSLWVFPILASFVIPVILVLIARKMNYSQNVLISTKIFVLIIIFIAVTLGSFALEINNIMNKNYEEYTTYTKDKWEQATNEHRGEMLDSFLSEYNIYDLDLADIRYYLSSPSKKTSDTYIYNLGSDNEFKHRKMLVIEFNELKEIEKYYILYEEEYDE